MVLVPPQLPKQNNEDQLLSSNFDGEDERLVEVPLEKAIIESITNAGLSSDLTKLKNFMII